MTKYWFTTQNPKVLDYPSSGLWVSPQFENHIPDISIGDRVCIYEPERGTSDRNNGAKALIALAEITDLESPWVKEDDDYWRIAKLHLTDKDPIGLPLRDVLKILIGEDVADGRIRGYYINRQYAGRVKEISREQYIRFLQHFTSEEDDDYQFEVENEIPQIPPSTPQPPEWGSQNGRRVIKTNASLARYCIENACYKCEIDNSHTTFLSRVTGNSYVEAHHLIPLKYQSSFDKALDNEANIVSLCPNCHRLLHHADTDKKEKYLRSLLNTSRKKKLAKLGTPVSIKKLLSYY